ncbi:MAG: pyridoxal-phosphate dependent enzyme [Candidatus Aminicenantales bacterium]
MIPPDFKTAVPLAYERIRADIERTRLEFSPGLSELTGARVYVKWENRQFSGSFKFRGALNKLRALSPEQKRRGVVSASTGNHGLGLSRAAEKEGIGLTLVLPISISSWKRSRLEESRAAILEYGDSCEKSEIFARQLALREGKTYISPYNDPDIIFGQATIGLEVLADLPTIEDILIPVGGGGLAAGIAGYLKAFNPSLRVFGVEPVHSAFMAASIRAGRIVEIEERKTVADAVAGGIEAGSITFPLCRNLLDGMILVEEEFIKRAMSWIWDIHHQIVEGAGALALAALVKEKDRFSERQTVLIASGGNRQA